MVVDRLGYRILERGGEAKLVGEVVDPNPDHDFAFFDTYVFILGIDKFL